MTIQEAIRERHSVRRFTEKPIGEQKVSALRGLIDEANRESGLHIQLVLNEPESFNTLFAHYGRFANAVNYIAIVGPKDMPDLEEKAGYYGQKLVLEAQMMGLRTCWAGGSFSRGKCRAEIDEGEKNVLVIAIGYGQSDGKEHRSKPVEKVCTVPESEMPEWFRIGVEAALLAPTAINQQKFTISMDEGGNAVIKAGRGPFSKVDLGIVKYNFEAASGHKCL